MIQEAGRSSEDEEINSKSVGFLVDEEDGTVDRHDKLKRTNTPHYTKGKRLYPDTEGVQEKFYQIMAKVGQKDLNEEENSDDQRVSVLYIKMNNFIDLC